MKDFNNNVSEKSQMLKARFEMFTKLNDGQNKMKMNRYKEASGNKKITFVNVK